MKIFTLTFCTLLTFVPYSIVNGCSFDQAINFCIDSSKFDSTIKLKTKMENFEEVAFSKQLKPLASFSSKQGAIFEGLVGKNFPNVYILTAGNALDSYTPSSSILTSSGDEDISIIFEDKEGKSLDINVIRMNTHLISSDVRVYVYGKSSGDDENLLDFFDLDKSGYPGFLGIRSDKIIRKLRWEAVSTGGENYTNTGIDNFQIDYIEILIPPEPPLLHLPTVKGVSLRKIR